MEITRPVPEPCPPGQLRKSKGCVGRSGAGKPPRTLESHEDATPPAIAALTADRPHRPREILILVDADRSTEIATRIARQYNVRADPRVIVPLLDGAVVRLRIKGDRSLESVLAALSADPDIEFAQPNYLYEVSRGPDLRPNVPQYANEKIRLEEAHQLARGRGVSVAVIDTAIDSAHPELINTVAGVYNALESGPCRPELHGTGIAGILVAQSKLKGVAPEAKLLSVCAFRGDGKDRAQSTTLQVLKGVDWAFHANAKIMNMSFAGPKDPLLERVIKAASIKGVIFIAAAGNNGPKAPPAYPAAYSDVLAITATDDKDKLYAKANRGDHIFIAAPGVDVIVPTLKSRYGLESGTSMAAAHVAGIVALILERNPKLGTSQIRDLLSGSARNSNASGRDFIGAGIVDAAGALASGSGAKAIVAPAVERPASEKH
jgi:subtilisin family serine protease